MNISANVYINWNMHDMHILFVCVCNNKILYYNPKWGMILLHVYYDFYAVTSAYRIGIGI